MLCPAGFFFPLLFFPPDANVSSSLDPQESMPIHLSARSFSQRVQNIRSTAVLARQSTLDPRQFICLLLGHFPSRQHVKHTRARELFENGSKTSSHGKLHFLFHSPSDDQAFSTALARRRGVGKDLILTWIREPFISWNHSFFSFFFKFWNLNTYRYCICLILLSQSGKYLLRRAFLFNT